MSSFVGSASFSEMGSSQGFKQRSHKVAQATVFKRDFKGQGLAEEDQLELLVIIQVKEVNSLDQVSASKTGDRLSSSVKNFSFGCIFFLLSCPDTKFPSAVWGWFSAPLYLNSIN